MASVSENRTRIGTVVRWLTPYRRRKRRRRSRIPSSAAWRAAGSAGWSAMRGRAIPRSVAWIEIQSPAALPSSRATPRRRESSIQIPVASMVWRANGRLPSGSFVSATSAIRSWPTSVWAMSPSADTADLNRRPVWWRRARWAASSSVAPSTNSPAPDDESAAVTQARHPLSPQGCRESSSPRWANQRRIVSSSAELSFQVTPERYARGWLPGVAVQPIRLVPFVRKPGRGREGPLYGRPQNDHRPGLGGAGRDGQPRAAGCPDPQRLRHQGARARRPPARPDRGAPAAAPGDARRRRSSAGLARPDRGRSERPGQAHAGGEAGRAAARSPHDAREAEDLGRLELELGRYAEADRRRDDLEGRRRHARLLAVGLDRQRRLRLDDHPDGAAEVALGVVHVRAPVELVQRHRQVELADVAPHEHVEHAVVRLRHRQDLHAAGEVAAVAHDHVVRDLVELALVDLHAEPAVAMAEEPRDRPPREGDGRPERLP